MKDTKATKAIWDDTANAYIKPSGPQIGGIRIAKVTYDHYPVHKSDDGMSIGQLIDDHLRKTIEAGNLVSEVALFFETQEQQCQVAEMYRKEVY